MIGSVTMTDQEKFLAFGAELVDAIERAIPDWVRRAVHSRLDAHRPAARAAVDGVDPGLLDRRIAEAGSAAAADVAARLSDVLQRDVDDQWTNPLSVVRDAIRYPTEILSALNVPEVERDRHATRILPEDVYDLAPANFAALGPEVHECGIRWGAAKAHLHLQRRKNP